MDKLELIQELMSVELEMENLWKYHPLNPNKIDIVTEYDKLLNMKQLLELDLDKFRE